jgi:Flp pilus assembly CpaE family ATPase
VRIDVIFLERCMVREAPQLAVLSAEEPFDTGVEIDPAAAVVLIDELKQAFDRIVIDLPRGATQFSRAVLAVAHNIVVVTSALVKSLRDAAARGRHR